MKHRDEIIESTLKAFANIPIDITKIRFLPDGLDDSWKKRLRKIADLAEQESDETP